MDEIGYISSVTSASSLLGNSTLLPGNGTPSLKLSCDEYVAYVDELLRSIAPQVSAAVHIIVALLIIDLLVFSFSAVSYSV